MSEKDQVRPYHAKDVGSGKETADTLAEVLKHAAQREEASRKKTKPKGNPKWMLPLGINLGVLAVYLLIAPPSWVVLNPIEAPPAEEQVQDLRMAMFVVASRIENYRLQNGRIPAQLDELGMPAASGLTYVPQGASGYQLVGSLGDETVIYDSSESLAEWGSGLDFGVRMRGG